MPFNIRTFACILGYLASTVAVAQRPNELPLSQLRTLAAAYGVLKDEFVTPVSGEALIVASLRGMLREIDPEGGEYNTNEEIEARRMAPDGAGVGVELVLRGNQVVLLAPIDGGPAAEAGLHPGDTVLAVDGAWVRGLSVHRVLGLLRGTAGSKVVVDVQRGGSAAPVRIELERRALAWPQVVVSRPRPAVAVLRVPMLRDRTLEDVAAALTREWRKQPFKGLVLDVRRNPGGLVDSAVGLAAIFLPPQSVVAKSAGQTAQANRVFRAELADYSSRSARDPLAQIPRQVREMPLVVLVDEGTASGAEIVAAALKDHHRATIVGRRTFGRASIQTMRPIGDGAVTYTSAYWESPSGARIHGTGIAPDHALDHTEAGPQLDAAIELLAGTL